jgi:hypothetical protein
VNDQRTPDLWEGTYDNTHTNRREIWQDGKLRRYVRRECVGSPVSVWPEVHAVWATYPDLPSNQARSAA